MKNSSMYRTILIAASMCVAGSTKAMVRLDITNGGDKVLHVQLFEHEPSWIPGAGYTKVSDSVTINPSESSSIDIAKTTSRDRYLYYDTEPVSFTSLSHIQIPKTIEGTSYKAIVAIKRTLGERAATIVKDYDQKYGNRTSDLNWSYRGYPELSENEKEFLRQRGRVTEAAIQNIIKQRQASQTAEYKNLPRIALCTSGGGFRAMLSNLGFTLGMQDAGLLDTITYTAALSGSTWFALKWLADGGTNAHLQGVVDSIQASLDKGLLDPSLLELNRAKVALAVLKQVLGASQIQLSDEFLAQYVAESYFKNASPGILNQYGSLLADALLNNHPNKYGMTLSSLADIARLGGMPLPLCTAITSPHGRVLSSKLEDYTWYEFTPFTSGIIKSSFLTGGPGFIPTWSLGRTYVKGITGSVSSIKDPRDSFYSDMHSFLDKQEYYSIEPSLNQLMAAFGSAFTVSIIEAAKKSGGGAAEVVATLLDPIMPRFSGLMVNNFYNPEVKTTKEGTIKNPFELRDAGIAFNLPVVPLLNPKRGINIAIILDTSANLKANMGQALKEFTQYAKYQGIKLPTELESEKELNLRLQNIQTMISPPVGEKGERPLEVPVKAATFGSFSNPDELTVIYIPTVQNNALPQDVRSVDPLTFDTFKLQYTHQESNDLIKYNRALGNQVSDYIKQIIEQKTKVLNK